MRIGRVQPGEKRLCPVCNRMIGVYNKGYWTPSGFSTNIVFRTHKNHERERCGRSQRVAPEVEA